MDPFADPSSSSMNDQSFSQDSYTPSQDHYDPFGMDSSPGPDNYSAESNGNAYFNEPSGYEESAGFEQMSDAPASSQQFEISGGMSPIPQQDFSSEAQETSSKLAEFNANWEAEKAQKALVHEQVLVESKEKAKQDLEKLLREREIFRESKQQANRAEEQTKMERLVADIAAENPWERVTSLVDLKANNKKTSNSGSKGAELKRESVAATAVDVSRMKQLFIQLKNEPLENTRCAIVASE